MNFTNLKKNQKAVVRLLENSFINNRLVHVYLFSGPKEALKLDAAYYLASLILCTEGGACGKCEACKKIDRLSNPDLYYLAPDGETIKKEQIEDLEHEFSFKIETPHVFIIQDIDKATPTSANTLLKFLEDLNDNCYGILLTENINRVLPTIQSRSQIVKFLPISNYNIKNELINRGISKTKANVVSNYTNDINQAFLYAKDSKIDLIINTVLDISDDFENYNNGFLSFYKAKNEFDKMDKNYHRFFFETLIMLQKDKINYLINRKEDIVFEDELNVRTLMLKREEEIKLLEVILKYRDRLETNANLDMVYTQMFVNFKF